MLLDPKWETKKIEPWRQLLLDAARLIETKGHTKGVLHQNGSFCLRGALNMVAFGSPRAWRPLGGGEVDSERDPRISEEAIMRHLGLGDNCDDWNGQQALINWNNAPERTAKDVIKVMRTVALKREIA